MNRRAPRTLWTLPLAWLLALSLAACARGPRLEDLVPQETAAEESTPLGGEALAQRKHELQRVFRDMVHFHTTLVSLDAHSDQMGMTLFSQFVDRYMGMHLEPLIRGEWQSRHPELMALDASLRFVVADVLIRMREPGRSARVIAEIEQRFQGRDEMLVDYPVGRQGTVRDGLEILKNRKWWRG